MRYVQLAEALVIAEAVTGIDTGTLAAASRLDLLDSALHAPQAAFEGEEFYPSLIDKAAVLVIRIVMNHPLPDGNKRLGWQTLTVFLRLNGHHLAAEAPEAVELMVSIASGQADHGDVSGWLEERVQSVSRGL